MGDTQREIKGLVNATESFGAVDGPGLRFIVFLQGCAMRCRYCHNPETWQFDNRNAQWRTPEDVFQQALRYKAYWRNGGGITVSGGEALLQIDFVIALFTLAKKKGIHTCLDTSGNPFTWDEPFFSKFETLCDLTDLFLLDIKEIDNERHKKLTAQANTNILEMATYLSDKGKAMWIRHVLVPGITTDIEGLTRLAEFIDTLHTVERVEVLPYHAMAIHEWERLGIPYTLENVEPPTQEQIDTAERILKVSRYKK
ncbi:pyruvate formate-lyase-activating protein [Veillonella montpellierensis]|uniref:pyruvate formate-lyase-activating protein n=1 Tax=Veillonella montpellierensis TaxID=187328 RepID=UPI0003FBF88A|nr:pyruvate formate-lyase-activating protein [Veillonella montpellierensis]